MERLKGILVVHRLPRRLRLRAPWLRGQDGRRIRAILSGLNGVVAVRINPHLGDIVVRHDGLADTVARVHRALSSLPAEAVARRVPVRHHHPSHPSFPFAGGALLVVARFLPPGWRAALTWWRILPSLTHGVQSLARNGLTVEALDAAAVGISAWRGEFMAALTTRLMVDLGEHLQRAVERRADDALHRLLPTLPESAWVEQADGQLSRVPGHAIRLDDRVVVAVGEMIPVDGEVVAGVALVNESSLTGEPLPVRKEAGKPALSGSVVEEGRLTIRAVRVGERTAMARIARFIDQSADVPSRHQRLADTLARKRVRWTFGMGGLIWLTTRDSRRAASSLLVDFSCGIKISTPVAFKAAMIRAGREGVLIKGGEALEHLALADTVVFDKTGTLTAGDLAIVEVRSFHPDFSEERLLAITASLEEHASHPLAEAVVREGNRRSLPHVPHGEVEFIVAHGLFATVDGAEIRVGSRHYLEEDERISFAQWNESLEELLERGLILLLIAHDRKAVGVVALEDHPRPEAQAMVTALRRLGIRHLAMLTGDRRAKAQATGSALGMDRVYWEMIPERKAEAVEELKRAGHRVIFVGDGINDAPALAVADVGIAMPRGAEIARDTADVVLLQDRLDGVLIARAIALRTLEVVRGNFSTAVSLNSAILTGAGLGWLSPVATSVLHNGATLGVLARSWGLNSWNPDRFLSTRGDL
ncbi:MAG: heavy metal translocating P-type ATPase [Magnetococcales bacterium]|nr:heavy metal translocating P-type ATPase [Magnetococcales bacterium]